MAEAERKLGWLQVCHVNCQSLTAHIDEFRLFFQGGKYQIICMSETWLKPEMDDAIVHLNGYTLFRKYRAGRNGGGVGFFVENALAANVLACSTDEQGRKIEYILAEVSDRVNSKVLLAVVYRPPHCGNVGNFLEEFGRFQERYQHSIILGDFNIDMLRRYYESGALMASIQSAGNYLVPFGATHHLKDSSTFIDLCIIDDSNKLLDYGQIDVPFLSAHNLIYIKYEIALTRPAERRVCM